MKVCDHENPVTLRYIFESVALHQDANKVIDPSDMQIIETTCSICGARILTTVRFELVKKGKSRKTNRLWALLKGVA